MNELMKTGAKWGMSSGNEAMRPSVLFKDRTEWAEI